MKKQKKKQLPTKILILGCIICLYGILSFCKLSLSIEKNNINSNNNNNNLLQIQQQQQNQNQNQQRQRRRSQTHEEIGGDATIKNFDDDDKGKNNNLKKKIVNNHDDGPQQQLMKQQQKEAHDHDVISTATASKSSSSSSLASSSSSICKNHHVVYDQIRVANVTNTNTTNTNNIKILCFIMTHSNSHTTKVQAVIDTWGKRCDTLLIASNITNKTINAIKVNTDATYLNLWLKLNETMQYIYNNYYYSDYDWILKADDDSYVIMENLKFFLLSDSVQNKIHNNTALIFGRRYSSPRYRNLANQYEYFASQINSEFGKRFYNKINKHKPVLYNYGGSGYVMNWNYIQKFVNVMKGPDTIFGTPPEDQANGVVMAYHNIWPQPTRDKMHGREQFHPENPDFMYSMDKKYQKRWNDNHKSTGGISVGPDCCSENSIVFHHINPNKMRDMEQIFYDCRRGERSNN